MPHRANLETWYRTTFAELKRFRQFWLDGNAKDPGSFPMDMRWGDWDEQFHLYETESED